MFSSSFWRYPPIWATTTHSRPSGAAASVRAGWLLSPPQLFHSSLLPEEGGRSKSWGVPASQEEESLGHKATSSSSVNLCASLLEATKCRPLCPTVPLRQASRSSTAVTEGPALSPNKD